tara:strand:+ start:78 stop:1121 length:1044 start_codon:yes stop_codon:yes gene_type:complete
MIKRAEAHSKLGNTLKGLGKLDEAEASYRQAIALEPDYTVAHYNLGITLQDLGRLEESETSYRQAIALEPGFTEIHYNLGNMLQELDRLDEAEASYRQAIALKPNYAEAHNNLGKVLMRMGQHREGLKEQRIGAGFISFNLNNGFSVEKVTLSEQNLNPNFIGSWMLNPLSICDELITYFESNKKRQQKGLTGKGENIDLKDSIDITVLPKEIKLPGNEVFEEYFNNLFSFYQDYTTQWPFLTDFAGKLQIGEFNLQRYQSGQHFQALHTERGSLGTLHRLFAWMTYLNDVDEKEGGSTYFSHYGLEIQPKKGLTLIWPAEWTHAHKGNLLNADSKYIMTGWLNFEE